jgi:hypothetical protein
MPARLKPANRVVSPRREKTAGTGETPMRRKITQKFSENAGRTILWRASFWVQFLYWNNSKVEKTYCI